MFACSPKDADSQCISDASKLCDNVCDCGNCADEENCLALAPTDLPMDPDSTKSLHVSGLLHWKVNGRFHPLSLHLEDQVLNVDLFDFTIDTSANVINKNSNNCPIPRMPSPSLSPWLKRLASRSTPS